ncbi:MAG: MotA/TolQ/ExbB proton channel family protein, partial [Verrucomicrobiota bacterium]
MVELISASSLSSILAALPVETLLASLGGFDYALRESSLPGQVLVGLLLVLSCFSWAVMITKFRVLAKLKARNAIFLDKFREAAAPMDLYEDEVDPPETPFSSVYQAGCSELDFHARRGEDPKDPAQPFEIAYRVNPAQTEAIRHRMDRAVGDRILELESQMTVLATAVSGAPFLGLLGTVWGVMDTFAGVAGVAGGASLQVMAPGVSAALVTTVIALLVAIPAMFGYNYLVRNIRVAIASMEQFAAEISTAFERRYTDYLDSRESTPPAPRPAAAVLQPAPEPSPTPPDETPPPPAKAESPAPAPLGPPPFTKAPVEPAPAPALEASKPVEAPAKKELSSPPAAQGTAPPPPPPPPPPRRAPPPRPPPPAP